MIEEPQFPELRVLDCDGLKPHEDPDPDRLAPLQERLQSEGRLKNPPLVLRLGGKQGYLLLDGANRHAALAALGYRFLIAQVVHPDRETIHLQTWNRVILGASFARLLASLEGLPDVSLRRWQHEEGDEQALAGRLWAPDGSCWAVETTAAGVEARLQAQRAVLTSAGGLGRVLRTSASQPDSVGERHSDLAALLTFPPYSLEQVLEIVTAGFCLPTGMTRFIVSPRALHINYPLSALAGEVDRETLQSRLDGWIEARLREHGVRHYAEETYLFDE